MKRRTKIAMIRLALAVLIILSFACPQSLSQIQSSNTEDLTDKAIISPGGTTLLTSSVIKNLAYPYGIKSAAAGTDAFINSQLQAEYDAWKALYVTDVGAGPNGTTNPNYRRVQRDAKSGFDTVSEGQAYGMLFAVYFNDETTFAQLWRYVQMHREPITLNDEKKSNKDYKGLMHWMMDKDGNETTEFGIQRKNWPLENEFGKAAVAWVKIHKDAGNGNKLYMFDPAHPEYQAAYAAPTGGTDANGEFVWLRASMYDRVKRSSATDADMDIAASLIMASKLWPSKWVDGSEYHTHAADYLTSVLAYDVQYNTSTMLYWLTAGNLWGGEKGWNPCYFTPAWIRMFKTFVNERPTSFQNSIKLGLISDDWGDVTDNITSPATVIIDNLLTNTYQEMMEIDAVNGTAGLYPDWVDTRGAVPKKTVGVSDRRYYFETIPSGKAYLTVSTWSAAYDRQSFNYYYDSVRVPWRIAMDYSYYGNADALAITTKIANFFKPKLTGSGGNGTGIVDGYAAIPDPVTLNDWRETDKDGFNMGRGGTPGSDSVTFIAMNATAAMVLNDQTNATAWYDKVYAEKEITTDPDQYHYYGNCVRLLSLLYMSGRMVNFGDIAQGAIPRAAATNITVGPLTIDTAYTNYAAFGSNSILLNDRSAYFNADKTAYANVSAGLKGATYPDPTTSQIMNVGYMAYLNGVVSGLPYTQIRDSQYKDWVLATGTLWKSFPNKLTHPWGQYNRCVSNYGGDPTSTYYKDPGLMDYSIDMTKFTPNSTDITVDNGGDRTISAGNFGTVKVMNVLNNVPAKLRLSGGVYHMDNFTTEPGAQIFFDTSVYPIVIFVKNQFTFRDRSQCLASVGVGADPSRILIVVGTSNAVTVGPQTSWRGTLIAPNAGYLDVNLHNPSNKGLNTVPNPNLYKTLDVGGDGYGAIWGKNVEIHQDSAIFFTPLDWTAISTLIDNPTPTPSSTPTPTPGTIIDLTTKASGQSVTINTSTTYKIKVGWNGVFQLNDASGDNVTVSFNGGAPQSKPNDWGGQFTGLGANSVVNVTIYTSSNVNLKLEWW